MKHFLITFKPDNKQISIHAGATLIEAAGQAGIILNTVCGGKGICRKCLVVIEPDGIEVQACQYHIESDVTVTIPPESRFFEPIILEQGEGFQAEAKIDSAQKGFGLAVDIGTTSVVAKLINMADGRCEATRSAFNPQSRFGDDVISRISYARNDKKLNELHETIIDCINELIARLCEDASIEAEQINRMCAVGNTAMNHIFLKFPVEQLGRAPYAAYSLEAHDIKAEELGLRINPAANVHTVENIAGFVGSDTTAVALAVDIDSAEQTTLVVDIGTNGELVLGTRDKLYAASCAAGPAFEGARITCGSRAAEGAIQAVVVNDNDIDLDVIGNVPARSLCGSGLIDAVAVLLDLGVVDSTGRFVRKDKLTEKLSDATLARLIEHEGKAAFLLSDSAAGGAKVFLNQQDIRETQLAKAAIRAGIRLLEKKLGLADSDIKQIYLAGAFGNFIRKQSALRIGLLPDIPLEQIRFVGNAAAAGAQMALISEKCRDQAKTIARQIEYIEIAHEKEFMSIFTDSLEF